MESAAYEAGDICDNVIIGGLNMRIAAVICEYNPFHNGHKHQIDTARTELGCDGFIGLMSGNFVQRGEFAVFDKSVRAAAAIAETSLQTARRRPRSRENKKRRAFP